VPRAQHACVIRPALSLPALACPAHPTALSWPTSDALQFSMLIVATLLESGSQRIEFDHAGGGVGQHVIGDLEKRGGGRSCQDKRASETGKRSSNPLPSRRGHTSGMTQRKHMVPLRCESVVSQL